MENQFAVEMEGRDGGKEDTNRKVGSQTGEIGKDKKIRYSQFTK